MAADAEPLEFVPGPHNNSRHSTRDGHPGSQCPTRSSQSHGTQCTRLPMAASSPSAPPQGMPCNADCEQSDVVFASIPSVDYLALALASRRASGLPDEVTDARLWKRFVRALNS